MRKFTNHENKTKKGFTLIELLVVVAIISLLVSILLPSLNKARDLAKKIACSSTIKLSYYGLQYYSSDFDGIITPSHGESYTNYWYTSLVPYMDVTSIDWKGVWLCPNDQEPAIYDPATKLRQRSYMYSILTNNTAGTSYETYKKWSNVSNPGNIVLMSESFAGYALMNPWNLISVSYRHPGPEQGVNVLYFDGHVSSVDALPSIYDDQSIWWVN